MMKRLLASVGLAVGIALVASMPLAGQGSGTPAPDLVITAYNGGPAPAAGRSENAVG